MSGQPTEPIEGDVRPQQKGGNKNPKTWSAVNMRSDPSLSKVVDNSPNPINIADQIKSLEIAQNFIEWHKMKYEECLLKVTPRPGENDIDHEWDYMTKTCNEIGTSTPTENGVKELFKILPGGKKLVVNTLPTHPSKNIEGDGYMIDQRINKDGVRYNIKGDFAHSMDMGIYMNFSPSEDDDFSFKPYGGKHSGSPKFARCYSVGIAFDGSYVRVRTEHEHNSGGGGPYSNNIEKINTRLGSITNKWIGFRFIGIHKGQGAERSTRLITFIDPNGLTNGDPSNRWIKIADWTDKGNKFFNATQDKYNEPLQHGPPYGKYPYAEDGNPQQTIRVDAVHRHRGDVEDKYLWCWQIDPDQPLDPIVQTETVEERDVVRT